MKLFSLTLLLCMFLSGLMAQTGTREGSLPYSPIKVYPQNSEGIPIGSVILLIHKAGRTFVADSAEMAEFYKGVNIYPGSVFNQSIADMAMRRIDADTRVKSADYELYSNNSISGPLVMVINIYLLQPGEHKTIAGKSGLLVTGKLHDFPVIIQNKNAQLTFLLTGGAGLYNENNAFFAQGAAFTQGNPVADDPAGKGVRFWGEAYLEPGIAGITRLGRSNIYAFGALSALVSGRNTSDIYSSGPSIYIDFERLYAGLLFTQLGKRKNMALSASYGRQFFQLNDGFLISKFSGSANAGDRSSVYLNSRTTFQRVGQIKFDNKRWSVQGFYIEPEELFKDRQTNIAYAGGYVGYNDNRHFDVGLAYLNRVRGKGNYQTSDGDIPKKGLYVLNPKLWISNIIGKGIFFKSEYAFEAHSKSNMRANGWYIGTGWDVQQVKWHPIIYYRYAFMQGDKENDSRYTRYDPILTGGLGDWVQGINMRKVLGNGNINTHRIQYKMFPSQSLELSLDYFHLRADSRLNVGGLPPLSELKSKHLGDELTFISHYFINEHFMLLGLFSYAIPGKAIREAFTGPVKNWSSVQLALFMFF